MPSGHKTDRFQYYYKKAEPISLSDVIFSAFRYGNLQPAFPEIAGKTERKLSTLQADEQVLLLTGIASPAPIMQELEKYTSHIDLLAFDDHHNFSQRDIQSIRERFKN